MSLSLALPKHASASWRPALVIALPLVVVLGAAFFGEPLFESNDDVGLAMLGSGFGIAAEPEPHLIFAHYFYGLYLNGLSLIVGTHAHGWTTLAALALSLGLFTRTIVMGREPAPGIVIAVLLVGICLVFLRALLTAQFTVTAALLFASAVARRIAMVRNGDSSRGATVLVYIALVFAFLIRPASASLGIVVTGPALLWLAWRNESGERKALSLLLASIGAIAIVSFTTDWASYALSPAWSNALEYNYLRSLFNDFGRIPWIADAPQYRQVGWSRNDYDMFWGWYASDPIFSLDNLRLLTRAFAVEKPLPSPSAIWAWVVAPKDWPPVIFLLGAEVLLIALLRKYRIVVVLLLAGALCAVIASALTGRPPQLRVWFAAMSIATFCGLPWLLIEPTNFSPARKLGLGLLVLAALASTAFTIRDHRESVAKAEAYRKALFAAKAELSDPIINWGAGLMSEWLVTPTRIYPPLDTLTIPSIALFAGTPLMRASLDRVGIADLSRTLCSQPGVRLIAYPAFIEMLQRFCEEHYKVRPSYEKRFENARTFIFLSKGALRTP